MDRRAVCKSLDSLMSRKLITCVAGERNRGDGGDGYLAGVRAV